MWYNLAAMARRGIIATLLLIIAAQMVSGTLFATVCLEPCPDDGRGSGCPPVCSLCTSCNHAQRAIVRSPTIAIALGVTRYVFDVRPLAAPSEPAADIFHVPLVG
jgi:hypothetical protein